MTSVIIHYEILKLFCSEKIYGGWWYVPIIESNSRSRPETWEWPWVSCPLGSWSRYGPDSRPWAWQYGLEPANWSNRTIAGQLQHILVYPIISFKFTGRVWIPNGKSNPKRLKFVLNVFHLICMIFNLNEIKFHYNWYCFWYIKCLMREKQVKS